MNRIYVTSGDERYFQPAEDLYWYVIPKIANSQAAGASQSLGAAHRMKKPGPGTLEASVVAAMLSDHDREVQACYEGVLLRAPTAAGAITATIDVDGRGIVTAVTAKASAGASLTAAADCAAAHAWTWSFPAVGGDGSTRVTVRYQLAPR